MEHHQGGAEEPDPGMSGHGRPGSLAQELEDWEWTENRVLESKGLWGQFFYLGNGRTELEADGPHCQLTPTFCRILSTFTSTLSCALCEVKTYITLLYLKLPYKTQHYR